jgi:hypothetical protein
VLQRNWCHSCRLLPTQCVIIATSTISFEFAFSANLWGNRHITGQYYDRLAITSIKATTAEIQGPWFKTLVNIKISQYFTNVSQRILQ